MTGKCAALLHTLLQQRAKIRACALRFDARGIARFAQAGIVPTSTNAVICELHRTWNRPEAAELAKLYTLAAPNYRAVMESYQRAQTAARKATA